MDLTPSAAYWQMPALLMSTSRPLPASLASTWAAACLIDSLSTTSSLTISTRSGELLATSARSAASPRAAAKILPTSLAGCVSSSRTRARPKPREAPVTRYEAIEKGWMAVVRGCGGDGEECNDAEGERARRGREVAGGALDIDGWTSARREPRETTARGRGQRGAARGVNGWAPGLPLVLVLPEPPAVFRAPAPVFARRRHRPIVARRHRPITARCPPPVSRRPSAQRAHICQGGVCGFNGHCLPICKPPRERAVGRTGARGQATGAGAGSGNGRATGAPGATWDDAGLDAWFRGAGWRICRELELAGGHAEGLHLAGEHAEGWGWLENMPRAASGNAEGLELAGEYVHGWGLGGAILLLFGELCVIELNT